MNEPTPPIIPVPVSQPPIASAGHEPNANQSEQVPIRSMAGVIEAVLREPRRLFFQLRQPGSGRLAAILFSIAGLCMAVYGFVTGTFSGGDQLWAAPAKLAAGLLISTLICLPSLFIFSCLAGSTARLGEVLGLLAGKVALTTILLVGFAPVAWVFSQSTESIAAMGVLHLLFWAIALFFGLRFLRTGFAFLSSSGLGIKLWSVIYLLVALQMTTALRPIIGTADTFLPEEKKFFIAHWLETLEQ